MISCAEGVVRNPYRLSKNICNRLNKDHFRFRHGDALPNQATHPVKEEQRQLYHDIRGSVPQIVDAEVGPGRKCRRDTENNHYLHDKCIDCLFMGHEFKFDMSIDQCNFALPNKCVRVKEDKYVQWVIAQILEEQFKDDMQTIIIMPQGFTKMPMLNMWDEIKGGRFQLMDMHHNVEAAKKIHNLDSWVDPYGRKAKLKVWRALVVWSDIMRRLSNNSRYFNMGNKMQAYQASWICTIMASREVWEFFDKPTKERENAKEENPKLEVGIISCGPRNIAIGKLLKFHEFTSSLYAIKNAFEGVFRPPMFFLIGLQISHDQQIQLH